MATNVSIDAKSNAASKPALGPRLSPATTRAQQDAVRAGTAPDNAPPSSGRLRRKMTHEQGRALESMSHAIDYLSDQYLHEGPDAEIINVPGPTLDALRILMALRRQLLESMPVMKPLRTRIWNSLFRRKPRLQSGTVVTLSSSR